MRLLNAMQRQLQRRRDDNNDNNNSNLDPAVPPPPDADADVADSVPNVDDLFGDNRQTITLVQQCGHRMHVDCFHKFYTSFALQMARSHQRHVLGLDGAKSEFVCPLCKRVANALLPSSVDSTLLQTSDDRSVDTWLASIDALLAPQPPSDAPSPRLSSMMSAFVTRVRAVDRDVIVSTSERLAMLNVVRAIVDTVRQCELRYRSVALARDSAAVLNVGHLFDFVAQERRWVESVQRLVAALLSSLGRDAARVHFALFWRQLHASGDGGDDGTAVTVRRIDPFGAFGSLLLLHACSTTPLGAGRAVQRAALLACLEYVYHATADALSDGAEAQLLVLLRQAALFELACGGNVRVPSNDAPLDALASFVRHFGMDGTAATDAVGATLHKRRRVSSASPLRLHEAELDLARRHFRFGTAFPRVYQTPWFFVRLTQTAACMHCHDKPMASPLLCLVCGGAFCGKDNYRHLVEHALTHNGIFLCLAVKDTRVYLSKPPLWHLVGTFYFDDHGEVDGGMRRGRPLIFHQEHMVAMLDMWLAHDAHSNATARL